MKKVLAIVLVLLPALVFARQDSPQPRFALVIGNEAYTNLQRLANPVNDANDIADVLETLGFSVNRLLNGNIEEMEDAVVDLKNRLSESPDSYGFFYYAGHAVQSEGENYLIPADARIRGENFLRNHSLSVQTILSELNDAKNSLNMIVLDACRDNPFGWARSGGSRGLAPPRQHVDSIIVYATSAGSVADDGRGRNGLFTGKLLNNLRIPGMEINEIFRRTGHDVTEASNRRQMPAIYNQFFGTAYLSARPVVRLPDGFDAGSDILTGSLQIFTVTAGTMQITGENVDETLELPAWGSLPIERINTGNYQIVMRYDDGRTEEYSIEVKPEQTETVDFSYRPAQRSFFGRPQEISRIYNPAAAYLNSIGVSAGTSFSYPLFISTIHGTYAPFRNSFFEIGFDLGLGSKWKGIGYYSFYPFARYALYVPNNIDKNGGWYAGIGCGVMFSYLNYKNREFSETIFTFDFCTGFIIGNYFNISYTLRTNFTSANNKFSLGYIYRFK